MDSSNIGSNFMSLSQLFTNFFNFSLKKTNPLRKVPKTLTPALPALLAPLGRTWAPPVWRTVLPAYLAGVFQNGTLCISLHPLNASLISCNMSFIQRWDC